MPLLTLLAFAFALVHARVRLGCPRTLLLLGLGFGVSLLYESVGVATGWVYGPYHYTDLLGPCFLGLVPYLIPAAWSYMITWASNAFVALQMDLGGPALAGIFSAGAFALFGVQGVTGRSRSE